MPLICPQLVDSVSDNVTAHRGGEPGIVTKRTRMVH